SGVMRNGTMTKFTPAVLLNSSAVRCWVLPGFTVPTLRAPGFARAALRKSPSVRNSDAALITNRQSKYPSVEIGVKSLSGLNGRLGKRERGIGVELVKSASV